MADVANGTATGSSITPVRVAACAAAGVALYVALSRWMRSSTVTNTLLLGSEAIGAENIILRSPVEQNTAIALGNLSPICAGHAVVVPVSPVPRLAQLSTKELDDLFSTVRHTQALLRRANLATGFNLAIKDGVSADQPVDQLHVHVVPRTKGDLEHNDTIYTMIDQWHPDEGVCNTPTPVELPPDDTRVARSQQTMRDEANTYISAIKNVLLPENRGVSPSESFVAGGPFKFSDKIELDESQVFYVSPTGLAYAAVNLKPLQPGHVLVIPRRITPFSEDLSHEEYMDLWETVRHVQAIVQRVHGAAGALIGMQDGRVAGQSVPHVHVHVLPR
eukprot:m.235085 g.235085  ORF g.235085 m.235085 type:complete len:333 (+) comp19331_c0_seq3:190-1188(+)